MLHTIQSVRTFLQTQRESDEPDEVLAILKQHDGKQLTKRLLAKLPGGEERWKLSQFATVTRLETRDYARSGGNTGIYLLMAYATTNVTIDAAWIEENNPAYFKGRRERNTQRDEVVTQSGWLRLMADALNDHEAAKAKLEEAKKHLDAFTEKNFSADRYDWERLCGVREEKKP